MHLQFVFSQALDVKAVDYFAGENALPAIWVRETTRPQEARAQRVSPHVGV